MKSDLPFRKSRVKTPTKPHVDASQRVSQWYLTTMTVHVADAVYEQRGSAIAYRVGDCLKSLQGSVFHR